jgi:hypothetical protein
VDLQQVVGAVFLIAVGLLMWGLLLFLRETQIAARVLRIPAELHEPKS